LNDLDALRHRLADLVEMHPCEEWSPALLRAFNGVLEMYIAELNFQKRPADVLELVKR
jgi:hypothetical protein